MEMRRDETKRWAKREKTERRCRAERRCEIDETRETPLLAVEDDSAREGEL
jgi:hypothetical protein